MKTVTCGVSFLAGALLAVAVAEAQQLDAGFLQDDQQGQRAIQQQPLPGEQPGYGAQQDQLGQPGATQGQAGQQPSGQQPLPAPTNPQAQTYERDMQAGGERGELGVWLAASPGPGVEIRGVTAGSAAEQTGLRTGDVLLQIDGQPVSSPMDVQRMVRSIPAGQAVMLEVWRDGAQQQVSATLQPLRERTRSAGYRGEEPMQTRSGDLEARTMRLEEQLNMVMRELQQLRQQMAQLHPESSVRQAGGESGLEQPASLPQANPFDRIDTTEPGPADEEPAAAQPGLFGDEPSATEPAETAESAFPAIEPEAPATETEPSAAETDSPATDTEPAATDSADDLFGEEPAEPAADSTPAEDTESETETDTDSLFE